MKRSEEVSTTSRRRRRAPSSDVGPAPASKSSSSSGVPSTRSDRVKTVSNPLNQAVVVMGTALGVLNDAGYIRKQQEIEKAIETAFNFGNGVSVMDVQATANEGLFLRFAPIASDGKTKLEPLLVQVYPQRLEDASIGVPPEKPGGVFFSKID